MSGNRAFLSSLSSTAGVHALLNSAAGTSSSSSAASALFGEDDAPSAVQQAASSMHQSMLLEGGVSVTEHVVNVLRLLREQPGRVGMTLTDIDEATGVKSNGNVQLIRSLLNNNKIAYDQVTGRFSYRAMFAADDLYGLQRVLRNNDKTGVRFKDIEDIYPGAAKDLAALTRSGGLEALFEATMGHLLSSPSSSSFSGRAGGAGGAAATSAAALARQAVLSSNATGIIRIRNDDRDVGDIVKPREPLISTASDVPLSTFTRLSGTITVKQGSNVVLTTADLTQEIARNDVIMIDGKAYRISSASVRAVEKAVSAHAAQMGEDGGQALAMAGSGMIDSAVAKMKKRKGHDDLRLVYGTPEERAAALAQREKLRAEKMERRKTKGRERARLRWQARRQQQMANRATSIAEQLAARGDLIDDGSGQQIAEYAAKLLAEANATGGRIRLDGTIAPGKAADEEGEEDGDGATGEPTIGPDGQPLPPAKKRGRPAGSKTKQRVVIGPDGQPVALPVGYRGAKQDRMAMLGSAGGTNMEELDDSAGADGHEAEGGLHPLMLAAAAAAAAQPVSTDQPALLSDKEFEQPASAPTVRATAYGRGGSRRPAKKRARLDEAGTSSSSSSSSSALAAQPSSDAVSAAPTAAEAKKEELSRSALEVLAITDDDEDDDEDADGPKINDDDISVHSSDASSSDESSDDEDDDDDDNNGGMGGDDMEMEIDFDPEAIARRQAKLERKRNKNSKAASASAGDGTTTDATGADGTGNGIGKSVRFAETAEVSDSAAASSSSSSSTLSISEQIQQGIGTLYPENGIYTVSVANDVKRTGGAFSVADTAPHRLPSTSGGYVHPFTATQIPLDRPYEGPDKSGIVAYKWGASLDIRTLWRLTAAQTASDVSAATGVAVNPAMEGALAASSQTPGLSLADSLSAAAASAPDAAGNTTSAGRAIGIIGSEGILPRIGGVAALRHLRPFPDSHVLLRQEMKSAGLGETLLEPNTNLTEGVVVKSLQERREEQRRSRIRKPHKANLQLQLGSLKNTAAGNAAQKAAIQIAVEKYVKEQKEAADARAEAAAKR